MGDEKYCYHNHERSAHYANTVTDTKFETSFGFRGIEGIHSRTNFDLSQHEKFFGKETQYFDPELNQSYIPYVIGTSIGVDYVFLSIMAGSYCEEALANGENRVVLKLPTALTPVKLAILPLAKKDGLSKKAKETINMLRFDFRYQYDERDFTGKRYCRWDAIDTPHRTMVSHDTLKDNCVTIHFRDTMEREHVSIDELHDIVTEKVSMKNLLKEIIE